MFSRDFRKKFYIFGNMGVASLKLKGGGGNFLKLIYSAVFNDGKKLEG